MRFLVLLDKSVMSKMQIAVYHVYFINCGVS